MALGQLGWDHGVNGGVTNRSGRPVSFEMKADAQTRELGRIVERLGLLEVAGPRSWRRRGG